MVNFFPIDFGLTSSIEVSRSSFLHSEDSDFENSPFSFPLESWQSEFSRSADSFDRSWHLKSFLLDKTCFTRPAKVSINKFLLIEDFLEKYQFFVRPNPNNRQKMPKMLVMIIELGFRTHIFPKLLVSIPPPRAQSAVPCLRGTIRNYSRIWILASGLECPKRPKNDNNFDISRFSSSYFSITFVLNSSIKIIIDSFFSVEGFSSWISLIFAQTADFSYCAENAEKGNFCCFCRYSN